MRAVADWLNRLNALTPESKVEVTLFRTALFGADPLAVDDWIVTFHPQAGQLSASDGLAPESWSVLKLLDEATPGPNLHHRHRLGAELAAIISLALDRRVVIPNDIAVSVPGSRETHFLPVAHVVDASVLGAAPKDVRERLSDYFSAVHGLPDDDIAVIGAATSAYHSALLLFDKEPRVSYTLLVAGIETLSRKYGAPPTDWESWNESGEWNDLLTSLALTSTQFAAVRERLMKDRQLRLGATFQHYAATRVGERFWDLPVDEWVPGFNATASQPLPTAKTATRRVSDFVPKDRSILRKSLALSYNLRSAVVHEARWVDLLSMIGPIARGPQGKQPLSFPALRLLLAELLRTELFARSTRGPLPDVRLSSTPPPHAA